MPRYPLVLVGAAALVALSATPAMADASENASCVGAGASEQAKEPPGGAKNFGQYTSSSVDAFPDPGVSGYVTFFAHLQPCPY